MAHEVEIAFFVDDKEVYEEEVKKMGFNKVSSLVQTDMMFDTPDAYLRLKKDSKIRLRKENGEAVLTFKGAPFITESFAKRVEVNLPVSVDQIDNYILFLESLGYPLLFQLEKERITYVKEDVEIVFDNYPILGWRMEIEGPEENILPISNVLFPGREYKFQYLSEFFLDHIEKTGKSINILKQEHLEKTGFDIGNIEKIFYYD